MFLPQNFKLSEFAWTLKTENFITVLILIGFEIRLLISAKIFEFLDLDEYIFNFHRKDEKKNAHKLGLESKTKVLIVFVVYSLIVSI